VSEIARAFLEEIAADSEALAKLRDLIGVEQHHDDAWIGVPEAAAHLGCKPQRIYDLVGQRRIPHAREGSRLLFRRRDLDEWVSRS
jgi:excisionase family DNA binding protein